MSIEHYFVQNKNPFPTNADTANPVFFRTYSRRTKDGHLESWMDVCDRTIAGLVELGKLSRDEEQLLKEQIQSMRSLPSGRWLWVGGTGWVKRPANYYGAYNCSSTNVVDIKSFALMMGLGMQGCGTGGVIENKYVDKLPVVKNRLNVAIAQPIGVVPAQAREEFTEVNISDDLSIIDITVGDSRQGWVASYESLLEAAFNEKLPKELTVNIYLGNVRPSGEKLKGFGGTSNPVKLTDMYLRVVKILNGAIGRKLTAAECCLVIDEAALAIVAGNVRRFAGMKQFKHDSELLKLNLWEQVDGEWRINPDKDAFRMSNHTRVFHHKPTIDECIDAVKTQYQSGEGAIQWAGEAIARANADLLDCDRIKRQFLLYYNTSPNMAMGYLEGLFESKYGHKIEPKELEHRLQRYGLNPCFRGDMRLLTKDGYKTFNELDGQKVEVINASGEVSSGSVWCTGERELVELVLTTKQRIYCTPDHRFMTITGEELPASDLKHKALMPFLRAPSHNSLYVLFGFIQGDGETCKLINPSTKHISLNIGKDDHDILQILDELNLGWEWSGNRHVIVKDLANDLRGIGIKTVVLPERTLPDAYQQWSLQQKAAFLNGLYSANGSVLSVGRITLKTSSKILAEQLLDALINDFGINAYKTTNKPSLVQFPNGVYQCKENYDINIQDYESRLTFFNQINFSLKYRKEKAAKSLLENAPTVMGIRGSTVEKVYDFHEPLTHWGVVEGFVAHNCGIN
jgi:ribonucleotide reductase class II